jgi:hypothetical protein
MQILVVQDSYIDKKLFIYVYLLSFLWNAFF